LVNAELSNACLPIQITRPAPALQQIGNKKRPNKQLTRADLLQRGGVFPTMALAIFQQNSIVLNRNVALAHSFKSVNVLHLCKGRNREQGKRNSTQKPKPEAVYYGLFF